MKKILRACKLILSNIYVLIFFNGFLLATIFFFSSEANYEKQLFNTISQKIIEGSPSYDNKDSFAIKAMYMANYLQARRQPVFEHGELSGFKAGVMHPSTVDLMTASGACGSYVTVLARILKANNYQVRIAQMQVNEISGGHIVVETQYDNRWILLDPIFNQYYLRPDGKLAGIDEVSNNWDYYSKQVKSDYPLKYNYRNIRYTNWNKIPVLMPGIKKVLDLVMGKEKADKVSLRPYFLRIYHIWSVILSVLYVMLIYFTYRVLAKRKILVRFGFSTAKHISTGTSNNTRVKAA